MIFIGPNLYPVTGQSYSFAKTFEVFDGNKLKICYPSKFDNLFIIHTIVFCIRLLASAWRHRAQNFYLTISRSRAGFYRDFYVFLLSLLLDRKIYVHLHGSDFDVFVNSQKGITKYLVWLMYSNVKEAIVLMDEMSDQFQNFPNITTSTIPNFQSLLVSEEQITKKISQFIQQETLHCIYLSNIINSKGIFETITAVKNATAYGLHLKLTIVGDFIGSPKEIEKSRLDLQFAIHGCDNIEFTGPLYGEQKLEKMMSASVFILPTYYPTEAQPISALEALATGQIILISDHNYLSYIFGEHTGHIVDIKSAKSIFKCLTKIQHNKSRYSKKMLDNFKLGISEYSIRSYAEKINLVLSDSEPKR